MQLEEGVRVVDVVPRHHHALGVEARAGGAAQAERFEKIRSGPPSTLSRRYRTCALHHVWCLSPARIVLVYMVELFPRFKMKPLAETAETILRQVF